MRTNLLAPLLNRPLQSILTHDTVYFFMDFSLLWMPVICLGLTSVVLAVHGVACALSVCKRRLLMDAQRARELLEEGPSSLTSSPRAVPRAARSREGDKGGGAAGEGGPEDGARSYLLWSDDEPGGTDSTKATP